jgi:predicted ester cyclase
MKLEQNKETILQLYQEITSRNPFEAGNQTGGNGFTQYTVSSRPSSLKAFHQFFASVATAFPDYQLNIDNLIVKGDKVMARYTISGTHQGDFMGLAPTHQKVTITGIDVFRLDKGRVVEHWDAAHQINAVPQSVTSSWQTPVPAPAINNPVSLRT